ncbi:RNA recognition domain-containing protein [Phlyctema vagabunda]|uniref:RNA recognition domain-containing protein n=1 Tax=Phlyctema vagabunda TaxID=108571 RepID=A0ABR4P1J4_9HELO
MPSRSPSPGRGRSRTRSLTPLSAESRSRSASRPRRTISPRQDSRSPRRNSGRYRSESRSISRSPSPIRSTKIVIEKLTKNVNEDHLREIFGVYGDIRDLDMPMNRQFMTNRGTAYILYTSEADAEAAIAHMHESQIDGAVINVSIVLPRRKFSPSPPIARRGANIDPRVPRGGGAHSGRRSPRRRSPGYRTDRNLDTYRPRTVSRSRSPRRHRTRSRSVSSRSRSPPRRRGGRRDSPGRNGGGRRRRSPSYSSYSSYDERDRSRSRSPRRGGGGRGNRR